MKKIFLSICCIFSLVVVRAQDLYFPPIDGNEWETLSPESLEWCETKMEDLFSYLENQNTKAFLLLKDGKIVIEKYFDSFSEDSIWYWASAGKTLTSFMVGIAQQEGHLSIHDKTSDYLGNGWTSCSQEQEDKITILNQLTMTTGLDDKVVNNYCTDDSCLIYKADAGTRWAYHNAPYTLLDEVILNATGRSLNLYVSQKLKTTTGMTGLFVPVGYNNIFFSTARSMARFGLLILNNGNWDGQQILTDSEYFTQMINTSQELNESYGYLWWLNGKESFMVPQLEYVFDGPICPDAPDDMIAALGKNGQIINVVPNENLVLIRMGNTPDEDEISLNFNNSIWQKINELSCNPTNSNVQAENSSFSNAVIYPNPAKNSLVITIPNETYSVKIIDSFGKLMFNKNNCFDTFDITISNFPNGNYLIQTKTEQNRITNQKLIVNR